MNPETQTVPPVKSKAEIYRNLPGAATKHRLQEEMLRVNLAGEYGAVHIYRGQNAPIAGVSAAYAERENIAHMAAQEQEHLLEFEKRVRETGTRPSLLAPFWKHGGFFLGAASRLAGEKSAHLCTEAVETVIDKHYAEQIEYLSAPEDQELREKLEKFRAEEIEHKELAQNAGAEQAPFYTIISAAIRTLCKTAVKVAKKV